jgi:methionine sulfoxide reductase catalytic subunit
MILDNNKRNPSQIKSFEIASKSEFENRRMLLKASGLMLAASVLGYPKVGSTQENNTLKLAKFKQIKKTAYGKDEKRTSFDDITSYNNYYEFGTSKSDPAIESTLFKPTPWAISIEGEVKTAKTIALEDL